MKTGIRDRRGHQPKLLCDYAAKEQQADHQKARPVASLKRVLLPARFPYCEREHRQGGNRETQPDEEERADVVHGGRLRDETHTPHGASGEQGEIGLEAGHAAFTLK